MKVLGSLSVPRSPINLGDSRARAYCTCSKCIRGAVWTFYISSIFSYFCLGPIQSEILSPTNQYDIA